MKQAFILDEVVVICAATHENPDGTPSEDSDHLINLIIRHDHQLVADSNVWERWQRQINKVIADERAVVPTILHLLATISYDSEKFLFVSPVSPPLSDEGTWSPKLQDDADFIRLAAQCHGVLSTLDDSLIQDILRLHLNNDYHFQVATVPESLTIASSPAA